MQHHSMLSNSSSSYLSNLEADIQFINILNKNQHLCNANLLKVGDLTILLDCGSDESYTQEQLQIIHDALLVYKVDFIFLSHASLIHVGALPYLQSQGLLDTNGIKVMGTSPTAKMGALTMYEFFIQKKECGNFEYFSLQDVERAFERIEQVSYNENRKIRVRETELILSALPSGNSIGGACWKIEYNKQVIIYAVELNNKPLNITVPMKFDDFKNANILISNLYLTPKSIKSNQKGQASKIYQYLSQEKLRLKLEKVLVDHQGSILIPLSDKNRILQCLITLENMFQSNTKLQAQYKNQQSQQVDSPVIYIENMSRDTLGVGRSHLGWMNFQDNKVFQDIDENPINFVYVAEIFSIGEYRQLEDKPRVIVTSLASFEQGFSRQMLQDFSDHPKNEILFLQKSTPNLYRGSLGQRIISGEKEIHLQRSNILGALSDSTVGDQQQQQQLMFNMTDSIGSNVAAAPQFQFGNENNSLSLNVTNSASAFISQIEQQQMTDMQNITFAQNQLLQSRENFMNKFYEKQYQKNFQPGPYPIFSLNQIDNQKPLTFYGEENIEEINDIEMNEEVAEVQQAFNNVLNEGKNIKIYNRFKDLQKRYGKNFLYNTQETQFQIKCKISYIPFEARIDKTSFELMLRQIQPKQLIVINSSRKKMDKLHEFITYNSFQTQLHYAHKDLNTQNSYQPNVIQFQTNAAVKQVFIDDKLYKSLPIQRVHQRYEISRIKAAVELTVQDPNSATNSTFDTLKEIPLITENDKARDQFAKKNLFFRSKDYKLSHLQHYLETQNIPTVIVDKCLNYQDKVYIYFDHQSGQIRLEGLISKDYFAIRSLIYSHFGRV
ncbi:cleavage and polyadenylation specificity factor subunit 2-like [Stylonychia lemnae]|uniref:Cleavage and polyadenylation specificity factor subunit 2 n=1 Tax=Stylonychia lemnae TaxID=5949 RepID=A0A077ZS41_STYLE|nr:cleavage and polyadenylation specificity factor subunit 2-like [Stylonychia lemnae]|eukprot:CDW72718.1 cleavage and polyadenylation specificity factor subunit 2-like [Stylonychia lemnae]